MQQFLWAILYSAELWLRPAVKPGLDPPLCSSIVGTLPPQLSSARHKSCSVLSFPSPSSGGPRPGSNASSRCTNSMASSAQRGTNLTLSSPFLVFPPLCNGPTLVPPVIILKLPGTLHPWLPRLSTTQALLHHHLTLVPPPLCHGLAPATQAGLLFPG